MVRHARPLITFALVMVLASSLWAKAPSSKDYMQPVDTSAGSLTDSKSLFQVNLDRVVSVGVAEQPMEIALNQISAILAIEWGFTEGVTPNLPITLSITAPGKDVLKALGRAAGIRFEVVGPTQVRLVRARVDSPKRPAKRTPPKQP